MRQPWQPPHTLKIQFTEGHLFLNRKEIEWDIFCFNAEKENPGLERIWEKLSIWKNQLAPIFFLSIAKLPITVFFFKSNCRQRFLDVRRLPTSTFGKQMTQKINNLWPWFSVESLGLIPEKSDTGLGGFPGMQEWFILRLAIAVSWG